MSITSKLLMIFFVLGTLNSCQSQNSSNDGTNGNLFNAVSNPKDDLVGDFSTKEKGNPEFRITKQGGNYFVSTAQGNSWSNPEQLVNVEEKDFTQLFGNNWKEFVEAGLNQGAFGIFKVKKGYQLKDHTFTTGYFLMFLGGGDVYKL